MPIALRANSPDDPIRLPQGWLSCRTCGVAVSVGEAAEVLDVEAIGRMVEGVAALTMAASENQNKIPLTFALCPTCRRTAEPAEEITKNSAQPAAVHLVGCALDALSFVAPSTVEHMIGLDSEGRTALVRHLAQLGSNSRWISRFVPVIEPQADPRTCSPYRFAHLKIGERQALRKAYAALLKERVARNAPPVKIAPPRVTDLNATASALVPVEGGCLFCGVGHQSVAAVSVAREGRAQIARDLWTAVRCPATQLGGERSPASVSGHLCRTCNGAVAATHSIGPSALERALTSALVPEGIGHLGFGALSVNGLVGWGSEVARAQQSDQPLPLPNTRPWQHLSDDLDELREQLKRRLGV